MYHIFWKRVGQFFVQKRITFIFCKCKVSRVRLCRSLAVNTLCFPSRRDERVFILCFKLRIFCKTTPTLMLRRTLVRNTYVGKWVLLHYISLSDTRHPTTVHPGFTLVHTHKFAKGVQSLMFSKSTGKQTLIVTGMLAPVLQTHALIIAKNPLSGFWSKFIRINFQFHFSHRALQSHPSSKKSKVLKKDHFLKHSVRKVPRGQPFVRFNFSCCVSYKDTICN